MKDMPNFKPGDRATTHGCPEYGMACSAHHCKIVGDPAPIHGGGWMVPIIYWCDFGRKHANYPCNKLIKTRSSMKLTKPALAALIIGGVLLILGMWVMGNYNSLVDINEDVDNAWAKVETQYQRRFDLIDNTVESVKGSQIQEVKVFAEGIADARRTMSNPASSTDDKVQAASSLSTNIAILPRLQEAYPELKSNQNVQMLMSQLSGTEGQIASARDTYNETVTNYNKSVKRAPNNIFAQLFGYKERRQFEAANGADKAPKVKFSDESKR